MSYTQTNAKTGINGHTRNICIDNETGECFVRYQGIQYKIPRDVYEYQVNK